MAFFSWPTFGKVVDLLAALAEHRMYASPKAEECEAFEKRGFTSVRATLGQLLAR